MPSTEGTAKRRHVGFVTTCWLMAWPLLTILTALLQPHIRSAPIWLRTGITSAIFVPLMTLAVAPLAARLTTRDR
jgi:antibiotic biosynthesis monooxygenase (ABM) superfamily enzyme